ncbi:TonB-dependent receptor [Novosphingobium sp. ZN18A2]|uniref:TonB-dependent receptor n=1 Tax=Novosphingobium sp. ZN18A2 TaxID=3079861 RepID=UPI0030CE91A1
MSIARRIAPSLLAASMLATPLFAAPALAQTAPDSQAAEAATPDAPAAGNGVIVVTAQRRAQSLEDVPASVQAFSGEKLKDLRVTSTEDLQTVVPSFNVSRGYQGVPIYTLRGIGFNTINLSSTSTVGTYVDEVALAYPFMNSGPVFDLERVEVLKGPQGTLYGRNTTAGLVDFITAKPTDDLSAGLTVEGGNFQTLNTEGFLNVPMGDGLAARLAWRTEDSWEGWQKSASRDEKLGKVHKYGARLTITAHPTDRMKLELGINGWKNKSDTLAAQGIGFTPNTDPANGTLFSMFNAAGLPEYIAAHKDTWNQDTADWAPYSSRSTDIGRGAGISDPLRENDWYIGIRGLMQFDLTDNIQFVSLTGYNKVKRNGTFDWSGSPYVILVQHAEGYVDSISQEMRFQGKTGPADWVIGGYYANDKVLDTNQTLLGQNANVGAIRATILGLDLLNSPFNSEGYTVTDVLQSFRTYRDTANFNVETKSIFASSDWTLTPALTLTTGIRYTKDTQDFAGCSRDINGSMQPNVNLFNRAFFYQVYGVVTAPIGTNQCNTFDPATGTFGIVKSKLDEDNVAWRVALGWEVNPDTHFFASVSRGYKSGSTPVNAANISTQDAPARQEELTSYELGTKLRLLDRKLNFNLTGFYYDYRDKQLAVYFADPIYTTLLRLDNVPKSRAYGLDGDLSWFLTPNLNVSLAATWLKTEIQGFTGIDAAGQPKSYDGATFPLSPEFSGAATISYDVPVSDKLGVRAIVNGHYQSSAKNTLENDPLLNLKPYGTINASIGVHDLDGKWDFSIWARNLTDEYYWVSAATNANTAVRFPGHSRTWGATLKTTFR